MIKYKIGDVIKFQEDPTNYSEPWSGTGIVCGHKTDEILEGQGISVDLLTLLDGRGRDILYISKKYRVLPSEITEVLSSAD